MKLLEVAPEPALSVDIRDPELQSYLQRWPFLNGPDRQMNQMLLDALPTVIRSRQPLQSCKIARLSKSEEIVDDEFVDRATDLLRSTDMTEKQIQDSLDRFSWKVREVPRAARNILDVGCGDGTELLLLRAIAPGARIVGIDWNPTLSPTVIRSAAIDYRTLNILEYLAQGAEHFDLVFSNHTLEHMYDPDSVLRTIRQIIVPGGRLISALPLDGECSSFPEISRRLTGLRPMRWSDLGAADLGHPWKTTPSDLRETLVAAGFANVRLVQREEHLTVALAVDDAGLRKFRRRSRLLQRILLDLPRAALGRGLRGQAPRWVMRAWHGLEQRLWFGANRLKNAEAPEILAVAEAL